MRYQHIGKGTVDIFEELGAVDIEALMTPYDPGSSTEAFEALRACWEDGPDATPGCEWMDPPGAYCEDE